MGRCGNAEQFVDIDCAALWATWLVTRRADQRFKGQVALSTMVFVERHYRESPLDPRRNCLISTSKRFEKGARPLRPLSKARSDIEILCEHDGVVNFRINRLTC